jgi:UDP-N-acetylmuramyl pentapeptide phosphotransferase/UDP-N-acetylglucosamine-1-phosphate transferase
MSFGLTWLIRRYALRSQMLDRPNERSLHEAAVPRGGGLAIVVIMVVASLISLPWFPGDWKLILLPLLALVVLLGAAGWVDDRRSLSPLLRLSMQLIAVLQFVSIAGHIQVIELGTLYIPLGPLAGTVSVLWILWLANGYNFMDGIDGIAASQASIVACTIGIWFTLGGWPVMALWCYAIMAAALGFLVWNWAPAQIFMGDVGSVTLGAVFGALAVIGVREGMPLGAFLILMSVFVADTTVTLLKRAVRGEVIWQAHKKHYYQRAVTAGWSHAQVTTAVIALTLVMSMLATLELLRAGPALWRYLGVVSLLVCAGIAVVMKEKGRNKS